MRAGDGAEPGAISTMRLACALRILRVDALVAVVAVVAAVAMAAAA
jgi:hypothetical protein